MESQSPQSALLQKMSTTCKRVLPSWSIGILVVVVTILIAMGRQIIGMAEDPYLTKQRDEIAKEVLPDDHIVSKERVYINDPSEAPEDAQVEEGPHGGYYYETGGGSGGGDDGGDGGGGLEDTGLGYEELIPDGGDGPGNIEQVERNLINSGVDESEIETFEEVLRDGGDLSEALTAVTDEETAREVLSQSGLDEGGDEGGEGGGPLDTLDEQYREALDSSEEQETAEAIINEFGEAGTEYVHEALHQDGDAMARFDSVRDALEDAQIYVDMMEEM